MAKKLTGLLITKAYKVTGTRDNRGIKLYWNCPNCGYKKNDVIDTIFSLKKYTRDCDCCSESIRINNPEIED